MKLPCARTQRIVRNTATACLAGAMLGIWFVAGCSAILGVTNVVGAPDAGGDNGVNPDARAADAQIDSANSRSDAPQDGIGDGDSSTIDSSIAEASRDAADAAIVIDAGADSSASDGAAVSDGSTDMADAPPSGPDANESGTFDAGSCATGACRRVFVTATQMGDGNIGGLSVADGICQGAADAQGIGGTWKAWLSDGTGAPSNRFVHASVPYRLLEGTLIANNWADLTSGGLRHPIDVDETLRPPVGTLEVWTGTLAGGVGTGATCGDWTSSNASMTGTVGLTNALDARWSNVYLQSCDRTNVHLYCFEQ